jgi:hypothetical protein
MSTDTTISSPPARLTRSKAIILDVLLGLEVVKSGVAEGAVSADTAEEVRECNAKYIATSEILFVALPFLILAMIYTQSGHLVDIFFEKEWSMISAVVMGQVLTRFFGVFFGKATIARARVLFVFAVLIVLVFIPILIVLCLVLISPPSTGLAIAQIVYFVISVGLFWGCTWMDAVFANS